MKIEQLVIDTMSYTDFSLDRALSGIAQSGISRVELCASIGSCDHAAPEKLGRRGSSKLTRLLESYNMTAVSLSAHSDITTIPGLIEATSRLQLAADMNIPIIIMPLPPGGTYQSSHESLIKNPEVKVVFCQNLLRIADLAASLGVIVCLETLGYLLSSAQQAVDLIRRLNHPNLRINYDPAALLYCVKGSNPTRDDIRTMASYLHHVHLNDKGSTEVAKYDFRPLGEGVVEWKSLLDEMNRLEFTGYASIEIGWEVTPETPEVVDKAINRACAFARPYFDSN